MNEFEKRFTMSDFEGMPIAPAMKIALAAGLMISSTSKRLRNCQSIGEIPIIADDLDTWLCEVTAELDRKEP